MPSKVPDAKSVLVAEDEKPYSRAIALKLEHAGFVATVVGNGEEALELLKKNHYDLLMLDLIMPKLNGFAVLEEIQKLEIKVPVIVLSNLSQEEDKKKIKAFGVEAFIEKSSTPIIDVINQVNSFLNN